MWTFLTLSLLLFHDSQNTYAHVLNTRTLNSSMLGAEGKISAAWYAGWHAADFPLSKVSWEKYTHLTYAFATTTPDVNVLSLADSDAALLPQFVSTAHKHGVKASLSIGGWDGGRWFSSNVGSAKNRTAFVKTVTSLAETYNLDGIDIDWEYPNRQGVGCNTINPADTSNLLLFLQELRNTTTGSKLILSAATSLNPFNDASNAPSKDVSSFSHVLDFIEIMNYDVWTSGSPRVGPNAPLDDACAPAEDRIGSAISSVNAWTKAGFPVDQIVLGVASYGHSFTVPSSAAFKNSGSGGQSLLSSYPPFLANEEKLGDSWDGAGNDACGVFQGPSGVYNFWGLIDNGFLNEDGSVGSGIHYTFDNCSQTPYVYNSSSQILVSFDNVQSFTTKGNYIGSNGLKGYAIWEAGGDSNDLLLDAILSATVNGLANPTNQTAKGQTSTPSNGAMPIGVQRMISLLFSVLIGLCVTSLP